MSSRFIRGSEVRSNTTVQTAAGNVVCVNESQVVVKKGAGAATSVTLPVSPLTGQRVTVKDGKGDAAANPITVLPAAGTIDGAASYVIRQNYGWAAFDYNGTEWGLVLTGAPASAGAGAASTAGVTASEAGNSVVHQTVLTLAALPVAVTDALAYGSVQLLDFPEGRILILGVTASIQWAVTTARTTINDNASLTWALGTAAASNITLTGTMVDLCPKTTKVLSAATTALNTASNAALAASAQFDGTGTAKDCFLNVGFETNTDIDADGTLAATGTVTITWSQLGDY